MAQSDAELPAGGRPRPASGRAKLVLLAFSTLFSLGLLEAAIRIGGSTDADGQFWFLLPLKPYASPAQETARTIQKYRDEERPYTVYDAQLGWTVNPNAKHSNGLYQSNNLGLRSERPARFEHGDRKRVALFGDSFVHGDDVPIEESFAGILARERAEEILNFGVGGYGNDQAWLRFRHYGARFKPDVVLIGFQPENCRRNINLMRSLMMRNTGIPFSKPRFVLEGNSLRLVNSPTVALDELPRILEHFEEWPLHELEGYYQPSDYRWTVLRTSRLLALLETVTTETAIDWNEDAATFENEDTAALCGAILSSFAAEAARTSRVAFLHLPRKADLGRLKNGRPLHHQKLLDRLRAERDVIDPAAELTEAARKAGLEPLFARQRNHYSGTANRIVATAVEAYLDGHAPPAAR